MKKPPGKKLDERIIKMANKLRKLRLEKGYTSYDSFAWDNDLSRIHYWRIERGSNITMQSLLKILDIHKITLEEFFKGIE